MTPLVLIPGMMCDARLFGPQHAYFSRDRSVLCFPANWGDTIADMAAQILDHCPDRFALAGLSLGGIVAMEMARQAPDRIERLALMNTNPLAETDAVKARREPQIAAVRDGKLKQVMRDEMKPQYLADGPQRATILDLCMDMAAATGADVFVRQSRALQSRPDQTETLRHFTNPTLVLCGRDDALCPVHRHELMHDLLPNSTLTIIDGAGHLPPLEQPTETTAAMSRWLEAA